MYILLIVGDTYHEDNTATATQSARLVMQMRPKQLLKLVMSDVKLECDWVSLWYHQKICALGLRPFNQNIFISIWKMYLNDLNY